MLSVIRASKRIDAAPIQGCRSAAVRRIAQGQWRARRRHRSEKLASGGRRPGKRLSGDQNGLGHPRCGSCLASSEFICRTQMLEDSGES